MCNNNCYLNTPTSQTGRQQQDSSAPLVEGEEQVRQLSPLAEMETPCCGCATEQAVDGLGVVEVDSPWEWDIPQGKSVAEAQSEGLMFDNRRSFLMNLWKYFRQNIY